MTWEEWQRTFWNGNHYKDRTMFIEGAGDVTYYRVEKALCEKVKHQLEAEGVEGLEIIEPYERGNNGVNYILIQNPNKIGPKIQYQNLLD